MDGYSRGHLFGLGAQISLLKMMHSGPKKDFLPPPIFVQFNNNKLIVKMCYTMVYSEKEKKKEKKKEKRSFPGGQFCLIKM